MDTAPGKSGPPLLRLAHAMAFMAFLRQTGAPVDRYLRSQKLPVLCEDPDTFVPLARVWSFFATAARREDAELGWLVGAHAGDHNLNAGLLRELETSPTLLKALRRLAKMARAEASHIHLGIREREDDILFCTQYPGRRGVPGHKVSQAYQLGIFTDLIRHFIGRDWVPDEIGLERRRVPAIARELYPGSRILAGQPTGYVTVRKTCLHRSARDSESISGVSAVRAPARNFDFPDTLREVLKSYLSDGYPTARFAAELMDVSERTLARRLHARGLTYGTLIDDLRFSVAKDLLESSDARIEEIAIAVGFEDQSNFTRMFRRIGGLTPMQLRNAARP